MNTPVLVAILLCAGVLFGAWRSGRDGRARRASRVVLQVLAAIALWFCLYPPSSPQAHRSGELVVLTPRVTTAQIAALGRGEDVVALPGVDAPRAIERVPDLAGALRRHADAARVRVVGGGLPARDRDAARGRVVAFDAAPLPRGIVALDAPAETLAGHAVRIGGRVEGAPAARIELFDPAGATVASATADAEGAFAFTAHARAAGTLSLRVRASDANGERIDEVAVPLSVLDGDPLALLVLAGAPDAELKFLRRWAVDAGARLDSRVGLSEGVALVEGGAVLDSAALAATDVVLVDERAWAALGAVPKAALLAAVDDGLGLLLRATGPLSPEVARDWAALGFDVHASGQEPVAVALARTLGGADTHPAFTRRPIDVQAADAAPLLRADDGSVVGAWRVRGHGRVGLWWLDDAFRLALAGERARYGTLWSDTFAMLARPHANASPRLPTHARVDERAVICDLAAGAVVESPSGERTPLPIIDGAGERCAAWWPAQAGWHALVDGERRHPVFVRARGEAAALAAADAREATRLLVGASEPAEQGMRSVPLPRWPFFLAWLTLAGMLWLIERARAQDGARSAGA
ncbi:MAG: Ig-like domain-containing protein [Dokdonella sp.]|uniref:Ig-like domain-containing protein n=1 Tax=Dokdonella sp. TaxID=2291710 RepID=UPI003F8223EB